MQPIDNQIVYWDQAASEKIFTHPLDELRFKSFVSHDARILDFGCGYGRTCHALFDMGFKNISGVDSSGMMIKRGRETYPDLDLRVLTHGDIFHEKEAFDVIILFAVLTCIPRDDAQKKLLHELYSLLRPGGIIYISDYWLQNDDRNLKRYAAYQEKYGCYGVFELPEGAVVRHHAKVWMASLLENFTLLEHHDIDVVTMNGNTSSGFQYFGRKP